MNNLVWRKPASLRNYHSYIDSVLIGTGWDDYLILTRPEVQDAANQVFEKSFLCKASVEDAFRDAARKTTGC